MQPIVDNIFADIPEPLPEELFQCLLKRGGVLIERIVSKGHCTPVGQYYDQDFDEWVMVLEGQAILYFEQDNKLLSLGAGDYVFIPAHSRHRVEWTLPDVNTLWLAVHL
jgi:cupin 2 domain-containing protein